MHNVIQQSQTGKKTRSVFWLRLWIGFLIYLLGGFPTLVFALPQDAEIVSGNANIVTSGNDMVVHQGSDKLITNWQSFNIGSGESVEFKQPSASSIALNNVIGLSPSVILGSLKANGQVFLSNGSGIIFGQSAQINVGGLLATTLGIKSEDFLAGNYNFTQDASRPLSSVINRGLIEASYVGLLAPGVENTGTIVANLGSVGMASGKAASLDFVGDGLINFAITDAVDGDVLDDEGNVIDHRVKNSGLIQADGGRVVLSAKDAGNIIQNVVNNEGIIEAHSAVEKNGEIFLMGGDSGVVANSGTLDASGKGSGETGGTVHMVGEKVGVFGEGMVDVSGNAGGGTALIGGDVQGGGDVRTATNTYVSEDATITADAIENGDGGKVVVWADDTTRIYGSVSATGGALSGDGGFVETSGKNFLEITRAADVTAAFGLGGEWLIDPRDITILAGSGNTGINNSNPFVSTGDSSILGVDLIIAALTGGANVTITTGSDGTQAGDITLNADLDFDGTGTNTLSFIAQNDIILNNSILDSSTGDGDTLNLVFIADSDLSGSGNLVVDAAASVESQGGSMQVTARDVDIQGTLDAGAGDITIAMAGVGQIQLGDSAFCPTCAMVVTGLELQNITASNLTVENSSDDIYVDSITGANSNNIGTVILDAGGNVEMGRDSDEAIAPISSSVFNALTVISDGEVFIRENLETDTGDLTLTADADSSGGVDDWITFRSSPVINSAGDITLNGSSSSAGIRTVSFGVMDLTSAGTITFNDDFSGTSFTNISADNGIIINADFITNNMDLNGDANGSADGVDRIVFADGITVQSFGNSAKIILGKAEALGSVTLLSGSGIDFLGDFTANGAVTIDADTATNVSTGTFSVASGTTFTTNNNTLAINASDVDFQGLVDVGSADMTITMALANGQIALGDSTLCPTCTMNLSGAELQNITASTLTLGSVDERILVDNVTALNSNTIGSITLNSGKHIIFQGNASTFNGLTASAKEDLDVRVDVTTDTGDLIMTGDSDLSGGNRFKIFSNSVLDSAGDLTLTHSGSGGTIEVTDIATMTAGGAITLVSDFTAGFHATLSANDGITVNGNFTAWGNINLDGDENSTGDSVTFAGGTTLESTNRGITLNRFNALGGISVLAAKGINVNGAFTSAGATVFNANSDGDSSGVFTVGATGSVATNNNTLTIDALDVDLQGTINAGALGNVFLSNFSGKIQLGDNTLCPTCTMQISGAELQNITAGTLTINSSNDAIFVDNVTDINSNNVGSVILNSAKHIAFQGNASTFNALTANATTDVDVRVSLTSDTGDLALTGDSDLSGGPDRLKIFSGSVLTSAGDIALTHTGGAGTIDVSETANFLATGSIDINGGMDVGTMAVLTAGGSIDVSGVLDVFGSMTMTSGGTITLDDVFTSSATATFSADNGINVNGDLTATGNVVLNGDANASVDGSDTIAMADGITVESTSGSVTFNSAASALGVITVLAANGINVNGAFTSAGATVFNADSDGNSTGVFAVGAIGSVATNNNTLTIVAQDIDLQGTINVGALGDIVLGNSSGKIQLGDNTLCPTCTMQISGSELQNITAGTLTINSSSDAILVDNVTDVNSNNVGMVILNSAKHMVFQGNASTFNALAANATTDMDIRVNVTTDTGDLIVTSDSDLTGGPDRFKIFNDAVLSSTGNLVLTLNGGAGNIDISGTALMTAGGTLTIDGDLTAGFHATLSANNGINLNGNVTAFGDIVLNGDANNSVDGNDTVTFVGGTTVESTDRSVTFDSAASALGAITVLAASGIDINDTFASLGVTTLNANSDADSSGEFTVSGSVQTNNNELIISANDVHLTGTLNAGTSDVTILVANNGTIGLGNAAGDMTIDGSELQNISASNLTLGSTANGNVTIDGVSAANSDNIGIVKLSSGGDINFSNNDSAFNALNLNAINDINVNTNLETDTGDFVAIADFESNNAGDFNLGAGNTVTAANDIDITSENVGLNGNLVAGGTITINGVLITGGGISIQAADGITLTDDVFNNGDIIIDADTDRNGVGDFEIIAGKIVKSFDNNISITANDFIIDGLIDAGAGTLTLLSSVAGSTIGLGNATGDIVISGAELQNITATDLIIGSTLNSGITVDGVTASDLINIGAVALNSGGDIGFSNADSTFHSLTVNAAGAVNVLASLTTDTGDLILSADMDSTGGSDQIFLGNSSSLTSAGDLTLNTSSAAPGISADGAVTIFAAGTLNINDDLSAADSVDISANNGINVNGDITSAGVIALEGDANTQVDGNDIITFADGITLTSTGTAIIGQGVNLGASLAQGSITINARQGLILDGDFTSFGTTTFNLNTDSIGFGALSVNNGVTVNTNGNDLFVYAFDVFLQGNINAGAGNIVFGVAGLGQIQLGDSTLCGGCSMFISGFELERITAGTLTLENNSEAIFVDNITAANSNNIGTMILNSAKHIAFQGNASTFNALTANATTDMDVRVNVTTDTGDLILTGDSDLSGGLDRFKVFGDQLLSSAGDLTLIHSGSAGTLDFSGSALLTSGGMITLGGNVTSGFQVSLNADDGINVNGDVTAFGDIFLNGDANGNVDGNDTIILAGGITLESISRTVAFDSATSALGIITVLATDGIDVNGAFSSNGATIFNADSNASGFGVLEVTAEGSISTNNNTLSITANDIFLVGTLSAGTSDITLLVSDNGTIGLGNAVGGMTIDGSEFQNISATNLTLGSTISGNVIVDGIIGANSDNVGTLTLNSGGVVVFSGADSTFNSHLVVDESSGININAGLNSFGGFLLKSSGDININANVTSSFGSDELSAGGSITTTGATIKLSALIATAVSGIDISTETNFLRLKNTGVGDVVINNSGALHLIASVAGGNLSVDNVGSIAQLGAPSSALTVSGTTHVNAAGFDVTLDNAANDFTGAVSVNGANVTLVDTNAINLGASAVTGTLDVTATSGDITDSGALNIAGVATFAAANGQSIVLDSTNTFSSTVSFNSAGTLANVTINDTTALDLQALTLTGNLSVTAGGAVTQSGSLAIAGATTVSSAGQNVTLDNVANDFTGAVSVTGANVAITDINDLDLGASTVSGTYTLNSGGSITQSGALIISGGATMVATQDITLTNTANDFFGIRLVGNNVTIVDSNEFVLGLGAEIFAGISTITGNLSLTTGGDLTSFGLGVDILGSADINATGFDVSLSPLGSNFGGPLSISGANVSIQGQGDINFGASAITGNFNVLTSGSVTQSGALTIAGSSTILGAGISLTNASNDFQGSVSGSGGILGGNVAFTDVNEINLGNFTVTGNLDVTAGGSVTNSGALTIAGITTVNATGHDVFLNNFANDFGGAVSVDGDFVALFDVNDLELGASTITNGASIIANGNLTQSGALSAQGSVSISAQDVMLTDAANDFQGTVFVSGNNVSITDANAIEFGDSTINGDFMLTAGGAVTQVVTGLVAVGPTSGSTITVAGTTMINAVGQDVTLFNGTNDFGGEAGINAGNVRLADVNSLTLKGSAISGGLIVYANNGVTVNGSVTTGGTTSINADWNADGAGTFSVTAIGSIVTNDNTLSIVADDIDLIGTLNAGNSSITLLTSVGGTIGLGNTVGDMTLTGAELQNITADRLNLGAYFPVFLGGGVPNGNVTVDGITAANSQNIGTVYLGSVGNIDFINNDSVFNSLGVDAANDINVNINVETDTGIFSAIADRDGNGSGTFTVAGSGSVQTNNNDLYVTANDIDLIGTLNAGTSDVGIWISDGGTIGLGNTSGDMTISGSELQNISAANLILGSASNGIPIGFIISDLSGTVFGPSNGNLTVDGITAANSQNIGKVILGSGSNIDFVNNDSVFNALNIHAVTDINVNTNLETDTGNFVAIADFENNTIGDFNLGTGTTVTSAFDIDITAENVNLNGNLNAGGTITINGEIFADDPIFLYAVDGIIITEDINNNEAITIDADTNRDGIGDFELVGGVLIKSNDYDISITANDFIIDGIIDAGLGNVTLVSSVGGTIGVGEAWGNIRIDNSELQNITAGNLIIGDENNSNVYIKNVQAVDVANISEMTLNATQAGKSVYFYGPASNLNDLTVNAANDVRVYGGLTAKDTILNAGDDVKLWGGTYSFDSLTAVAADDIVIYGTLNTTNADYTAGDDIWLDGYQTYAGNLNATAGDDISIGWELSATTATLTAGDDVSIKGTTRFGDLTVNASDDISIRGDQQTTGTATLIAGDNISLRDNNSFGALDASAGNDIYSRGNLSVTNEGNLSAGDDIHLHGNNSFGGELNASAGDDIHTHGLLTVTGDGNLDAGDDIHLHGNNSFGGDLNVDAGDDIHSHGLLAVGNDGSLVAGDDIHLHGTHSFGGALFAAANGDIRSYGNLTVTGSSFMSAGNDIYMNGRFNSGAWTAIAGDDIRLRGNYNISTADLKANDEIRIDRSTINSGNFSAEADFDNNGSGAFKLNRNSSITSTSDIALSGYGLKIKGNLSAAGTITLTDKSE